MFEQLFTLPSRYPKGFWVVNSVIVAALILVVNSLYQDRSARLAWQQYGLELQQYTLAKCRVSIKGDDTFSYFKQDMEIKEFICNGDLSVMVINDGAYIRDPSHKGIAFKVEPNFLSKLVALWKGTTNYEELKKAAKKDREMDERIKVLESAAAAKRLQKLLQPNKEITVIEY